MSWRMLSKQLASKGARVARADSLAGLHRRREQTQGQYFTPAWVAAGIWQAFSRVLAAAKAQGGTVFTVMDNAIGSGGLLEGAPVKELVFYGLDIDARCIDALSRDARQAGLRYELIHGGMADIEASGFHFAVINPPYSVYLESPNLTPYGCNTFGRFGQATSAVSHEYALEQALDAAQVVAAVLPVTMEAYCRRKPQLNTVVYLPANTFASEQANVKTAVYFFAPHESPVQIFYLEPGQNWPNISAPSFRGQYLSPRFRLVGVDYSKPTITLPVTGNKRVELHHHHRRIVLKYRCGLVQAKVANGLLEDLAVGERLPKSLQYRGDGQFLLDVLLLQEQPARQLDRLARRINALGGEAWLSPTLRGYYSKLLKRHWRAITPMYRVVKRRGVDRVTVEAKKRTLLEPGNFNSPSIAKGQVLSATPQGGEYAIAYNGHRVVLRRDELLQRFAFVGAADTDSEGEWGVQHPGLSHHFPQLAGEHGTRIERAGIDWLAPFQRASLIEGLISPYGYIGGWEQGSGKARYALALALLHSGRSMIVVESGLLPEMLLEIEKIGLPGHLWRVLKAGDKPSAKINLTTYAILRQGCRITYARQKRVAGRVKEISTTKVVRTHAQRWRRQINTLICDEGGLLANLNTQQTRAVKRLAARKLILLDGTPQRNYPRDLLPLCVAAAGNGTAHQPYGVKGKAYLQPYLVESASSAQRGEDAFYDRHVVTQWVTNEFREEMQSGGKREVPKINNLSLFRRWLAPNLQRRLRQEPDLAVFNNCPQPVRRCLPVEWDRQHFGHYLTVATEFAYWYQQQAKDYSKALNLVAVLARIGAVQRAANSPHVNTDSTMAIYTPLTSKQRLALERIRLWVNKGKKVILYAQSPDVLNRLHGELAKHGIDSVLFTGQQDINARASALNNEFRYGACPVLLSSWVGQRGLNLEQAGVVILYERNWSATTEEQAIYRTQRPSQKQTVVVEYLHLVGSIDEYCAQLVAWKRRAAYAGLDYGEQASEEEEFLHMDTLLNRFCQAVLNMSAVEAKEMIVA